MFDYEPFDATMERLRSGDEAAATAVFQRYLRRLVGLAGKQFDANETGVSSFRRAPDGNIPRIRLILVFPRHSNKIASGSSESWLHIPCPRRRARGL